MAWGNAKSENEPRRGSLAPDVIGPLRGPAFQSYTPHATQTSGLCAVGLQQVEAVGLVEVFDLMNRMRPPQGPTAEAIQFNPFNPLNPWTAECGAGGCGHAKARPYGADAIR